ncbi:MAG: hypothetical protein IJP17_05290, partial [Clostridia bacterium]|nr:hypothetical protein [Clostridia bacterium]
SLPLFVGVELYEQIADTNEEFSLQSVLDALASIAEPIFNLSMMDGVQSILQSYESEGAIMDAFYGALQSFAGQMFPTVGGQIARTLDDKSRNAYYNDSKLTGIPNWLAQIGRSAMSKTPVAEEQLPERIDAWGRNTGDGQSLFERAMENFISPGYYSKSKTTEVDTMLQELYTATGDTSVLPATAGRYFSFEGENYYMAADEYVEYAKTRGQTAFDIIDDLRQDPAFRRMSDDEKVACITDAYKLATAIAKCGTDSGYTMDNAYKWQREAFERGDYADAIIERR